MILPNVEPYRVVEPMYEGIRVILSYRGELYSPAYVQGISGAAFHVGGICPCAPTCTPGIEPVELVRKFGYDAEHIPLFEEGRWDQPVPHTLVTALINRVKADIHANRPVLVWHAFTTAEWDVVAGYDDERKLFLGRGSYAGLDGYAEASQTRPAECLEICPAQGAIFIGEKTGTFDAQAAEINSLKDAVGHAHSDSNADKLGGSDWVFLEGFLAFERWVNDFKSPDKIRSSGDAYCYGVYRSTHRAASDYLADLAQKYPMAASRLLDASGHFATEVETLQGGESLLWWNSPEGPDPTRNQQAAVLLEKSYDSYRRAIESIEKAINILAV
jgi:hypothetical protein